MTQLVENTYLAYEQFMEGELNQYDLASLIEEGIISEELLDSIMEETLAESEMLEEGWKKKAILGTTAAAMLAHVPAAVEAGAKHVGDWASDKTVQVAGNVINNSKLAAKNLADLEFKKSGRYAGGAVRGAGKKVVNAYDQYIKGDKSSEYKLKGYAAIRDAARAVQKYAGKANYLNHI